MELIKCNNLHLLFISQQARCYEYLLFVNRIRKQDNQFAFKFETYQGWSKLESKHFQRVLYTSDHETKLRCFVYDAKTKFEKAGGKYYETQRCSCNQSFGGIGTS